MDKPLNLSNALAYVADPALILKAQGFIHDELQEAVVRCDYPKVVLNFCRQAGKSSLAVAKAIQVLLSKRRALVLIASPTEKQAMETFDKLLIAYEAIGEPIPILRQTMHGLKLANGSRVICLSGKERSIRSYARPDMIIMDEGSRIPDDVYRAVEPMRIWNPRGLFWVISTPFGTRGFFYRTWDDQVKLPQDRRDWLCIERPADRCPWVTEDFIQEQLRRHGESYVDQEFYCKFTSGHGLVYPHLCDPVELDSNGNWLHGCVTDEWPNPQGRLVGGGDWGFRDPCAFLWGVLEAATDILWIGGEHYQTRTVLHENLRYIPKEHTYWVDTSRPENAEEMRAAGYRVTGNENKDIRSGIAAVTARIQTGRLRIYRPKCLNLIDEAGLYRYKEEEEEKRRRESATSPDQFEGPDHLMDSCRYLVGGIDRHHIARFRRLGGDLVEGLRSMPIQSRRLRNRDGSLNEAVAMAMPSGGGADDFWRGDSDDD